MFSVFRQRGDGENDENSIDHERQVQRKKKKKLKRMYTFREEWLQEDTLKRS